MSIFFNMFNCSTNPLWILWRSDGEDQGWLEVYQWNPSDPICFTISDQERAFGFQLLDMTRLGLQNFKCKWIY